jgi:ParB family chromosome partitioning protein
MASIRDKLAGKKSKLAMAPDSRQDHPANLNDYKEGNFYTVDIAIINPDPEQPRKYFNSASLEELSQSIQQKGVLQPVIIRRDEAGQIVLVAGERRLKAASLAGLEKIPCILTKGNPLEISIIENLQRENLRPIEEAEALSRMVKEHGYTQDKLAFVIGKAKSTVSETISLNRLPDTIKEEVRRAEPQEAEKYPRRLLVEIAKQETPEAMLNLFNQTKEGKLKSEQVRDIARKRSSIEKTPRTVAAIALDRTQTLNTYLSKVDFASFEQGQKAQLIMELQSLKLKIEDLIS